MEETRIVWMNGNLVPGSEANVPLLSHSFSRGSAIFETFGVHKSTSGPVVFRMDQHLKRLKNSADLLGMELKYGIPEIGEAVAKTIIANNTMRGVVKIMAFWGEEAIVNMVPSSKLDVAIFSLNKNSNLPLDNDTPLRACLSNWRKLDPRSIPVEAKAVGNYLNGYLARREAKDRGYDLSFMLGTDGFLAEGSIESIFLVKKNILQTPKLGKILPSISRMTILEIAQNVGINVKEKNLRIKDLFEADEIFTSHTGVKVHPVIVFEDKEFKIPGPITSQLSKIVHDMIYFKNNKFKHYFKDIV